jgi:hypothetical protein
MYLRYHTTHLQINLQYMSTLIGLQDVSEVSYGDCFRYLPDDHEHRHEILEILRQIENNPRINSLRIIHNDSHDQDMDVLVTELLQYMSRYRLLVKTLSLDGSLNGCLQQVLSFFSNIEELIMDLTGGGSCLESNTTTLHPNITSLNVISTDYTHALACSFDEAIALIKCLPNLNSFISFCKLTRELILEVLINCRNLSSMTLYDLDRPVESTKMNTLFMDIARYGHKLTHLWFILRNDFKQFRVRDADSKAAVIKVLNQLTDLRLEFDIRDECDVSLFTLPYVNMPLSNVDLQHFSSDVQSFLLRRPAKLTKLNLPITQNDLRVLSMLT